MDNFWNKTQTKWPYGAVVLFLGLISVGFYLLFVSRGAGVILSPWQVIHPAYIYVFFTVSLVLAALIMFSRLKVAILLFLLILYSLLLHSYLPATHELLYGADGWRHIANEEQILEGRWPKKPVVRGSSSVISNGVNTPEKSLSKTDRDFSSSRLSRDSLGMTAGGIEIGDLAYSGFWILSAGISKITTLNLITVNKWLLPLLWSLFFPLIIFKFGKLLDWSDRQALGTAWLVNLPFALQAAGSFTLPVNLGFLIWTAQLLLILKRLRQPNPRQIYWLGAIGLASIFNYSLFFILYWFAWGVAEVILQLEKRDFKIKKTILLPAVLLLGLGFTFLEVLAGYSQIDPGLNFYSQSKQLLGNFFGYYIANGPPPHDILTGNIIFNQIPSYAFVENALTWWRWWIPVFFVGFWFVFKAGMAICFKREEKYHTWIYLLTYPLFIFYIISRYFLIGDQVLSRRLDVVLAFFIIIAFSIGVKVIFVRLFHDDRLWATVLYFLPATFAIIVLPLAVAASYSLGPDTRTVSIDEYQAMEYIWSQEKGKTAHCVIADTYPLLALEAISKKEIIGGGFPINKDFAQPERTRLYNDLARDERALPRILMHYGMNITGAPVCWYVGAIKGDRFLDNKFNNIGVWKESAFRDVLFDREMFDRETGNYFSPD